MAKPFILFAFTVLLSGIFLSFRESGMRAGQGAGPDTTGPFYNRARDHKGKSTVSTSGVITFTSGLDNDYYQSDSASRTVYLYVEAKLARLVNLPRTRTPLNLSIVIDRSGSMQGVKMGYAKKAAKAIVDLLEPVDFVSVVMYDNAIDSVQEPIAVVNKEPIKSKIDRITARGSTNLWGGTERGYQYVKKNFKPGFINRVLLISDGLANVGLTDSLKIRQNVLKFKDDEGITLSTFGVGLDYNESLMTDMAETGAGNYYFIDSPDNLVALFQKELNGMLNVVAQNAEIWVQLPPAAQMVRSYPLNFTQKGNLVRIRLLDLFAEETRGTLLTIKVPGRMSAPLRFTTKLSYTDALDGSLKAVTNENILSPIRNNDAYLTHFNRPVVEQAIFLTANERLELAMEKVDGGDYPGARKDLDENAAYLKANRAYMQNYPPLRYLDSLNTNYGLRLASLRTMNADSLKKFQKSNKSVNYQLRYKKQ